MEDNYVKPSDLFPNMISDGNAITIPKNDLLQQDTSTGQALALNLITTIWKRWRNYSPSPTRARVTRNNPIGIGIDRVRLSHNFSFDVIYTGGETTFTVPEPPATSESPPIDNGEENDGGTPPDSSISNNNQLNNNFQLSN